MVDQAPPRVERGVPHALSGFDREDRRELAREMTVACARAAPRARKSRPPGHAAQAAPARLTRRGARDRACPRRERLAHAGSASTWRSSRSSSASDQAWNGHPCAACGASPSAISVRCPRPVSREMRPEGREEALARGTAAPRRRRRGSAPRPRRTRPEATATPCPGGTRRRARARPPA